MLSREGRAGSLHRPCDRVHTVEDAYMLKIEQAAGQVIAADTQASVAAIDAAVLTCSRLCSSIVEVSASSNLPISAAQKALGAAADALVAAVQGREGVAVATRELLKVQGLSTLQTTAFGCPDGIVPRPSGNAAILTESMAE